MVASQFSLPNVVSVGNFNATVTAVLSRTDAFICSMTSDPPPPTAETQRRFQVMVRLFTIRQFLFWVSAVCVRRTFSFSSAFHTRQGNYFRFNLIVSYWLKKIHPRLQPPARVFSRNVRRVGRSNWMKIQYRVVLCICRCLKRQLKNPVSRPQRSSPKKSLIPPTKKRK